MVVHSNEEQNLRSSITMCNPSETTNVPIIQRIREVRIVFERGAAEDPTQRSLAGFLKSIEDSMVRVRTRRGCQDPYGIFHCCKPAQNMEG